MKAEIGSNLQTRQGVCKRLKTLCRSVCHTRTHTQSSDKVKQILGLDLVLNPFWGERSLKKKAEND